MCARRTTSHHHIAWILQAKTLRYSIAAPQSAQRVRTHVYTRCDAATTTAPQHSDGSADAAATPATAMAPSFRWLALLAATANAQFPGMPGGPPADARPIFKTGKYLGCTVCKLAVEEIWKEALRLREEAPYKKPREDMYQDSIQQICDPIKDLGEWVAMYDITQSERGAPLSMEKQEYMCECRRECRTIQKACENIVNEHMEDMAESLYKRDAATLEKFSAIGRGLHLCGNQPVCPVHPTILH